ncbi:MAG: NEW3 domain-containing protein, partial [Deltaproteobacteria bacterium]|nr:NEW3 domain-containing protein [Deltaproteobacteria bacterium]
VSTPQSKESFNLIVPFKDLTVGQGQEVTMDAEVVNRRKDPVEVSLALDSVPKGWDVNFNSRYPSYPIRSVMVQGEKSTTIEFKGKVPDDTKPGTYQIKVTAKDIDGPTKYTETLNFRVSSKKVETGGLKLTSQYPVLGTSPGQTLKFTVDLKNETKKALTTSLVAQPPPGWSVRFKPQFGDQIISSIQLKEDGSETLSVEIDPSARAEPKEYPITLSARAGALEASTSLKVTLKGSPDLRMVTREQTLNTSVTAGTKSSIDLIVGNAGSAPVKNLTILASKKPEKWTVEFRPDKIDEINPGDIREIKAEILAPARTIAGDYLLTFTPNAAEGAPRPIDFRVTVSTPTIWSWLGFGIVGLVVIGLAVVFFRLGRR